MSALPPIADSLADTSISPAGARLHFNLALLACHAAFRGCAARLAQLDCVLAFDGVHVVRTSTPSNDNSMDAFERLERGPRDRANDGGQTCQLSAFRSTTTCISPSGMSAWCQ
jgi:hypothetical protein